MCGKLLDLELVAKLRKHKSDRGIPETPFVSVWEVSGAPPPSLPDSSEDNHAEWLRLNAGTG